MLIFIDGFRQYVDGADISASYDVLNPSSSAPVVYTAGPNGPFGKYSAVLRQEGQSSFRHVGMLSSLISDTGVTDICASFDFRLGLSGAAPGSFSGRLMFGVSPRIYADTIPSNTSAEPIGALTFEINLGVAYVYHSIVTNGLTMAVNKQLLGQFSPLVVGTSYTVQMRASVVDGEGSATVILNGETMTVSFDPLRVTPAVGFEQSVFHKISTASCGRNGSSSAYIPVSDIVVYSDDAETAWPLGPLDLSYLAVDNASLAMGPANDSTFVTVTTEQEFQVNDPAVGGEILGGAAYVRVGAANGNVPTRVEIDLVAGGVTASVFNDQVAPGFVQRAAQKIVPASMITADAVFKARSVN